jgi:hypothetical protein
MSSQRYIPDFNDEATTQNQALAVLLLIYKDALAIDLPWLTDIERAKKPKRLRWY